MGSEGKAGPVLLDRVRQLPQAIDARRVASGGKLLGDRTMCVT